MKKTLLLVSSITITALIMLSNLNATDASSTLSKDGNAGAPMDNAGQTCTSCHAGTATTSTATIITSNIPGSGYIGALLITLRYYDGCCSLCRLQLLMWG